MTPLQEKFLFGVFIYYILKGSIFVILYVALIIVEKHARQRQEQIRAYLKKKRAGERERWQVAYNLCEKQQEIPVADPPAAKSLSQLVTNPQSFTAYSSRQERWKAAYDFTENRGETPTSPASADSTKAAKDTKPLEISQLAVPYLSTA